MLSLQPASYAGPVSEAVAVIVGAIIGGLLTSVPAIVAEVVRSRESRKAQRRSEQRELREACRLILEELTEQGYLLDVADESGYWWSDDFDLPTTAWDRYGRVLAVFMDDENEWITVALAYTITKQINVERQRQRERREGRVLDDEVALRVGSATGSNLDAMNVLRRLIGQPEIPWQRHPVGWMPGQLSIEWEIEHRHRIGG